MSAEVPPGAAGPLLTVYGRTWCHLCQDMLDALQALQGRHAFSLEYVDVDEDAALERRFGERVPVLAAGGRELCHYHLDEAALLAYLRERDA